MATFEEGVAYRIDRNGNVKRVEADNGPTADPLPAKARKTPTGNKADSVSAE